MNDRLNRAVEIGEELTKLESVVDHMRVAYGNFYFGKPENAQLTMWDSKLFGELNDRRTALRNELVVLG